MIGLLPIVFFSLITGIYNVEQEPNILTAEDIVGIAPSPLNFSYKLFAEKYVTDIVLSNLQNFCEADFFIRSLLCRN